MLKALNLSEIVRLFLYDPKQRGVGIVRGLVSPQNLLGRGLGEM